MSSGLLDQKREELFGAAQVFVHEQKSEASQRALCEAASAYHLARAETFRTQHAGTDKSQTNGAGAKFKIPFGRTKGTPIGEATTKDLEFVLPRLKEGLDDPKRSRFRDENQQLIAAIEAELETR